MQPHPFQTVLNMWLAGYTWDEVSRSDEFISSTATVQVGLQEMWSGIQHAIKYHFRVLGIGDDSGCETRRNLFRK